MSKSFEKRIGIVGAKLISRSEKRVKKSLKKLGLDVISQTPVDKGVLINNWYSSNRQPITRTTKQADRSGAKSKARLEKAVAKFKLGQTFYMTNNLPYARVIEFGMYPNPPQNPTGKTINGFSRQAPSGIVRINMKKFKARIKGAV